jgi:hypothetical protein
MEKQPIKVGDLIHDVASMEDYTVLEVQDSGYLIVQLDTMKRAGLPHGKEVIHKQEIDGVHIKKY